MPAKHRPNGEVFVWIAGAFLVAFVVVVVVALLLDATGAIGGKRSVSPSIDQRHAVVVPVHPAPVARLRAPAVGTRATSAGG